MDFTAYDAKDGPKEEALKAYEDGGEGDGERTRGLVTREEAALAFADSREKLLAVLEDDHLNMEALSDLEIFELFWATELFPIYSQKSPHTKRAYKQDLDYILRFFVTKTQGVKQTDDPQPARVPEGRA